ncbi:type III restriction-modification system endonuclease [Streptomyces sp. NPDC093676]|uniref:type III restriction-modification system endonuclease n=1 Tax=Streptomyces sp. NPDC093676 TaxID=3366050 RepID=UPI00381AB4D9
MKTPKLHFSADLPHQQKAIEAVCDLFRGQETGRGLFTVSDTTADLFTPAAGVGNRLTLFPDQLGENLRAVQLRFGLAPSQDPDLEDLNFTIEMETGTGKTYVYLRTIYELNKRFGFTKFVIVVPSVAIKEGVYKSLQIMEDHFTALYDGTPLHYFPYDSSQLGKVRNFAYSAGIEVMIVTAAAINKQATARIYQVSEQTGGAAPIDLIKQTRPILIVDEPQSVDGGPQGRGKQALDAMHPLFTLRYSATHIDKYDMVYKLDAVDAYQEGLVKQIEVAGGAIENAHSRPYVRLDSISKKKNDFSARVEIDEASPGGGVRRVIKTVQPGDLLDQVTRLGIYEGLQIGEISKAKGAEFLQLRGGGIDKCLHIGEAHGDIPQLERARHLIRRTIREHLDKELELRPKGIKVLSLFFIERVDRYRTYGENGEPVKSDYALIFEEEYQKLKKHPKYTTLLGEVDLDSEAQEVHDGYFAQDKKGAWKDVSEGTGQDGADAERAYDLIMKDKERLLSLETPLKFIFSHSALREGWDNPNVFQICSLREMGTDRQRRQTIGRGLRLAVNQEGERVQGFDVNTLTVIATESYQQFAAELQTEIEVDGKITFGRLESHQFANLPSPDGNGEPIGFEASQRLYKYLQEQGYLDSKGKIDGEILAEAVKAERFVLPAEFEPLGAQVAAVLEKRAKGIKINDRDKRHTVKVRKQVFESAEFRELWERIKYKTTYRVDFDSDMVIEDCIRGLREVRQVPPARMRFSKAKVVIGRGGLDTTDDSTSSPETVHLGDVPLPDILSELADRTQLTRRSIQRILAESGRLNDFRMNPQEFLDIAVDVIMARKREALVDGVKYVKLGDNEFYAQELFTEEELHGYFGKNLIAAKRSVYEEVRYDSETERKFVEDLEKADDVKVYAKLPSWFKISTPLGSYNPDWAIVRETHDGQQHLYLVIETKGTLQEGLLRPGEAGKIRCGGKHFGSLGTDVTFAQSDSWQNVPSRA